MLRRLIVKARLTTARKPPSAANPRPSPSRRPPRARTGPHALVDDAADVRQGLPSSLWQVEELRARAQFEDAHVKRRDASVTPHYWFLGKALLAAREHFHRGEWKLWIEQCEIEYTRAKRGMQFARVFASLKELEGLTLTEAIQRAKRTNRRQRASGAKRLLRKKLKQTVKTLETAAKQLGTLEERADLLPIACEVGAAAEALRRACLNDRRPAAPK
jgi:hypothetical protein